MNKHDVAHAWANKAVSKTVRAGTIFAVPDNLYGGTIYSYGQHYPIAVWVGERTVLLNDSRPTTAQGYYVHGGYTAKHKTAVIGALAGSVRIIHVNNPKDIEADGSVLKDVVLQNYEGFLVELKQVCAKQMKARTADYSKRYNYIRRSMLAYLSLRGNVKRMTKFMREVFQELETADLTRMCEVFGHQIARDAEAEAKRKAKAKAAALKREAMQKAAAEKAKEQFLNKLPGWEHFSQGHVIRHYFGDLVVEHKGMIVTSTGVVIEAQAAKRVWVAVKNDVTPVVESRAGSFTGRLDGDTWVFGCHEIKVETIELFAQKMGWT